MEPYSSENNYYLRDVRVNLIDLTLSTLGFNGKIFLQNERALQTLLYLEKPLREVRSSLSLLTLKKMSLRMKLKRLPRKVEGDEMGDGRKGEGRREEGGRGGDGRKVEGEEMGGRGKGRWEQNG